MSRGLLESLVPDITRQMLEDLLADEDNRELDEQNRRMDYYRNELAPIRPPEMSEDTYRDRVEAWTGVPLASLLVNTIAGGMYCRDVARTTGNEAYDDALADVWKQMALTMQQNARLASVIGDTVIRILPDWQDGLRLSIWDGRHVIPLYDPDDPEVVVGHIYVYGSDSLASQMARALRGRGQTTERVEIVTRHIRDRATGAILQPGIRARFVDGERVPWAEESDRDAFNPLGDYLDGVFWRNSMDPTSCRGMSDLAHLLPMLTAVNESTTDARLLLLWNLYPILYTDADMESAPRYDHKAIWQLGDKANGQAASAGMIEWSQNLEGFKTHLEHLLALIHETARVPAVATGDLSHVGELSSGRAYEIAMRPYLDQIAERERLYEVQELRLMRHMIALLAYMGRKPFTGLLTAYGVGFDQPDPVKIRKATEEADIEFAPLQLAENPQEEATVHSQRIGAGFESIETAIRETHPDWSDDQVREELERVGSGKAATLDASADLRIAQQREELRGPDSGTRPTA